MTTDEIFESIRQQNDTVISLLARLVWTPEKLAAIVTDGKRNPDAYRIAYNSLDGETAGTQLAAIAKVTQQSMSAALRDWFDQGVVLNVGTDKLPKYKRLMRIPEARKRGKTKQQ